jgi:photosystem II stability/assembly factor-like uncharacterized protein
MKKSILSLLLLGGVGFGAVAQTQSANSLVEAIPFRSIGPTIMGGRVVDLDVNEANPNHFFVAFASGGLWETQSNGNAFTPLFDKEKSMTIGDIAVRWQDGKSQEIWIGTGECNSSRSSYAGTGVYKSTDGGKTWQHLGLFDSQHISRIVLHPTNPQVAWVAVIGHLYTDNAERGVFKTTDGGKTWAKTLFINDKTGAIDLVINPQNPDVLYAAMWERNRKAWNFSGSGVGSGIHRSTDGGQTWQKVEGFPTSAGIGRIGLAIDPQNPATVFAVLDNQEPRPAKEETTEQKEVSAFRKELPTISNEKLLAMPDSTLEKLLSKINFPIKKYCVPTLKNQIKGKKLEAKQIAEFLGLGGINDANEDLFNVTIKGCEVYKSADNGKTWAKVHEGYIDDVFYTYGYYFAQIRVSPKNPEHLYILGVPVLKSEDGGKNWKGLDYSNAHADHHALWINPKNPAHLILGNDGGVNISYNDGKQWFKLNNLPVGQFYAVTYDMAKPYNVYGGLQDNGVWWANNQYTASNEWQQEGKYPYQSIMGGDGMQVQVDFRDNETVYTGYQFGNYYRLNKNTGDMKYITPQHQLGESPYRWNWQTPIHLSRHQQDILYMGSHRLHRSLDKGETFQTLSGDLTKGKQTGKTGNIPYGTLTTIDESPLQFGLLYVGSDDGVVSVSKDGGYNWENISNGLPQNLWVSRITASKFVKNRVYVSLNGYRNDDFKAYLYVSEDMGKTWKQLQLPVNQAVNVIKEDTENENLLYVGTDNGLWASLDRGKTFQQFAGGLPNVAVHDLAVHPREKDLIVGTHGRSLYVANVEYLQQLTPAVLEKSTHLFATKNTTHSENWGKPSWSKWFGYNEPKTTFVVYLKQNQPVSLQIKDAKGNVLKTIDHEGKAGLNYINYDLTLTDNKDKAAPNGKTYIGVGEYTLEVGTEKVSWMVEKRK